MMKSRKRFENTITRKIINYYIQNVHSNDLTTQIEAVVDVIYHCHDLFTPDNYNLFIQHFPKELYDEFLRMNRGGKNDDSYYEIKSLFFDVFIFIFGTKSLITNHSS
ncbi:hypothetical protein RF11_05064 [Thelohanellus kitauei]|uniref:Uncharacterized protein n=1 Tax=Thelohanellus kitauei TaxID=669202 RepID=A0A0C2JUF5_THEKT|nr:hypothetical protein RF11_05064 [Thelohanellus kitauei]